VQNQTSAQQALNEALAQYGPGSAQATEASIALQQANLGVGSAAQQNEQSQAALTNALRTGKDSYANHLAILDQLKAKYPEAAAAVDLEKAALDRAKAAADAATAPRPPIEITADTSQFHAAMADVAETITEASGKVVSVFIDTIHREFNR
jgi:hypothetical protein